FGLDREAVIARELTKLYESIHAGTFPALLSWAKQAPEASRGELVLLVHGAEKKQEATTQEILKVLQPLLKALPLKQAVSIAVEITGLKRNYLYQLALEQRTP